MPEKLPSIEVDLKEYGEVASTWRYFVSLRFTVVGFAAIFNSALFTIYAQLSRNTTFIGKVGVIGIPSLALAISIAVIVIEQRTVNLYNIMLRRGTELEF